MSWKDNLRPVEPYVAGEQPKIKNLIKLNTNENPYSPGAKVAQAIKEFNSDRLRLYPNADAEELRHALAEYHHLTDEQVFIGNGSDEVLALTFLTCFNSEKPLFFPDITYSFYPVFCKLYQIDYKKVPLDEHFNINKQDYYQENGGIIFPNPNAPTGLLVSVDDVDDILQHNQESIVVIDEAYVDFGGMSALKLLDKYENLLIIKTFSKFRSLAGSRLGAAYGNKELIAHLYGVKNSFNSYPIDSLSQAIGLASVKDSAYVENNARKIIATREKASAALKALGFKMPKSYANFIFVTHPDIAAAKLFQELRERGIVVRYFNQPRIDQYLRITIGTDQEMQSLIQACQEILAREDNE